MLIDSNNISIDQADAAAAQTGVVIPLTSLLKPGREEPVCVYIRVSEQVCGGDGLTLKILQADKKDGEFAEAAKCEVKAEDLLPGVPLGWRWLPPSVTKPWIKFVSEPKGEIEAGPKITCAVVREDPLDYEDGMYIDKGALQC